MRLFFKLLRRLQRYRHRAFCRWRKRWFLGWEGVRLSRLEVGRGTVFLVPVRSEGSGSLCIGKSNTFGVPQSQQLGNGGILLQPRKRQAEIRIGNDYAFNNNVAIVANGRVTIGNGCQIGDQVAIYDCDFHEIHPATRNQSHGSVRPVEIGNNVWLGSRVMVLKGVRIGDNSVIGAMSLVNKSIPPNCLAAGNPAKVIRVLE